MKKWIIVCLAIGLFFGVKSVLAHEGHEETASSVQTIKGEVIDLACYLNEGNAGAAHRDCAQKCIASGLPVGIKSGDKIYIAISGEHGPANAVLAPLAAKNVTVEGTVTERNGVRLIAIKKITAA